MSKPPDPTAEPSPSPAAGGAAKRPWRSGLVVLALAAIALAALAVFVFWPGDRSAQPSPVPVARVVVEPFRVEGAYRLARTHVGQAEAPRVSRVSGELGGAVLEVMVDEGDRVERDEPLVRFDVARLEARREQVDADLARQRAVLAELAAGPRAESIRAQDAAWRALEAEAALARATAERFAQVRADGAVSVQEFDQAQRSSERAEAAAAAARARLEELQAGTRQEQLEAQRAAVAALSAAVAALDVDIAKAVVKAPFPGVIGRRLIEEGEVAAPGAGLLELREVPAEGLDIRIGVRPAMAAGLKPGDALTVRVRGVAMDGEVTAVRPDRLVRTRTVPVLVRLTDERAVDLAEGEIVDVDFPADVSSEGGWVPIAALTEGTRGLWRCFVLEGAEDLPTGATHQLVPRSVEVVHFDGDRAFVRGALRDRDRVVRDGTHRLLPGLAVQVAEGSK